jgi:hypothetical protein
MKLLLTGISFLITAVLFSLQAQDTATAAEGPAAGFHPRVTCSGLASYEFGQIYNGVYAEVPFEHRWENRAYVDLNLNANVSERLRVIAGLEGEMSFSQRQDEEFRLSLLKISTIYLNQAEGIITILDDKSVAPLSLHGGYMLYKYDDEARNLGEYLFRSMTYPQVLFTQFDFPKARIMGLRLNSKLWQDRIVSDLFITTAVDFYPMYDYSIAYVGSIKPIDAIEFGFGVDLDRILSVDNSKTTPKANNSFVDTLTPTDTTFYSFAGTKIMARMCFDPKAFFPHRILGQEDLKIFGEMAILGVKNYPGYYSQLWQRIPLMFGANVDVIDDASNILLNIFGKLFSFNPPTLSLLDVLSFQGEYYRSPYPNSYYEVMFNMVPEPYIKPNMDWAYYQHDDWKWSVYASKKILGGLSIIGQIANDHTRVDVAREEDAEYEDVMRINGMWCWMLKMKFEF